MRPDWYNAILILDWYNAILILDWCNTLLITDYKKLEINDLLQKIL